MGGVRNQIGQCFFDQSRLTPGGGQVGLGFGFDMELGESLVQRNIGLQALQGRSHRHERAIRCSQSLAEYFDLLVVGHQAHQIF